MRSRTFKLERMLRYLTTVLTSTLACVSCAPAQNQAQTQEKGFLKQAMPMAIFKKGEQWQFTFSSPQVIESQVKVDVVLGQPRQQEDSVAFSSENIGFNGGISFNLSRQFVFAIFISDKFNKTFLCGSNVADTSKNIQMIEGTQLVFSPSEMQKLDLSKLPDDIKASKVKCRFELVKNSLDKEFFVLKEAIPRKNPKPEELQGQQKANLPKKGEVWESEGRNKLTGEVRKITLELDYLNYGDEQFVIDDIFYSKPGNNKKSILYDSYLGIASLSESRYFGEGLSGQDSHCYVLNFLNEIGLEQKGYFIIGKYEAYRMVVESNDFSSSGECWIKRVK